MRKIILVVVAVTVIITAFYAYKKLAFAAYDIVDVLNIVDQSVTQEELLEQLEFLASEDMGGRPTGTIETGPSEESIVVTTYLVDKLKSLPGLKPAGTDNSPLQNFQIKAMVGENYKFTPTTKEGEILSELDCPWCNRYETGAILSTADSRNVAFYIEGSELPNEYVILMAHYDHIGLGKTGRSPQHAGTVHPGAEDNASGTSALLEVAETFSDLYQSNIRPKRSIVFLFAGAEEKGLLGAVYYAHKFPLSGKVVAVISNDMVGRGLDNTSLWLTATPKGEETPERIPEIWNYIQKWSVFFNFTIESPPDEMNVFYRSDHYAFFSASPENDRIPAMLFSAKWDMDKFNAYKEESRKIRSKEKASVDPDKRFYYHTIWDTIYDEHGNLNIKLDRLERHAEFITLIAFETASGPRPDYVEQLKDLQKTKRLP
ncbi:M28 family peptidase [Patescibacteria group bacterium AH-259-L05]|nr:M28 family peptidase [Patescibacteria group bacterium AH-259-L05]